MKQRLYFFAIVLTQLTAVFALNRYPDWFLHPLTYPGIVAGFSYDGEAPVTDAERMYCVYQECIVKGSLQQFREYEQRDSDYYYNFDADSLRAIHGKLYELDSFYSSILQGDMISAFGLDSTGLQNSFVVEIDSLQRPDWIDETFYSAAGYYYGVGMYTSRSNVNDAWKTAEEKAFFSIMSGLALDIRSVLITDTARDSDYDRVSSIRLKYKLKGLEIVERYPDTTNDIFYVLVRIEKQNVFSPLLKQSSGR
ncbi:MAG: hypothetical protein GXO91_04455 [FCB group bacterium]|nr:hypothetical protein [FCB group bacterium]